MSGAAQDTDKDLRMQTESAELLTAGAVLPPSAEGAGERAVPLTARAYRHPGLDERVVVRLVTAELGPAEDAAAGFLGLEPQGEPAVVGLGLRQALGFPEWVLAHHPKDGHHALAVVPELERAARQAKSKPKNALDAYQEIAGRLAGAVPHFLPTFYEQAGRVFLSVENSTYAAQMFTKARTADAEHGLRIDEERLDAVFLEFALAGALPVKVLAGYGRELTTRLPAQEALERFTRLCIRRTAGGMPPSAQMAVELRKLAKAAGANADTVEQEYLAELLGLPATLRAVPGWWKAHRAALLALARREAAVRRTLLDVVPAGGDGEMPAIWLDLLLESGAADALHAPDPPAETRPADGASGWLRRFQRLRESSGWWRDRGRLPQLYPLVERCAGRLRAELSQDAAKPFGVPHDVDLLDLLLSLGLPVADPADSESLRLERWSEGDGQRDLLALAADERFRAAFHDGADRFGNDADGLRAISTLIEAPGGRPLLAGWMREIARVFSAAGLPHLPEAMRRLSWLPGAALALAGDEVRAAAGTDLAPVLARTLRAGLFDELGWPAWEEAAAALVARKDVDELVVADAWPHLIVAGATQARVIGVEGTVLTHDLRIPNNDRSGDPGYHYVDGELLVHWNSRAAGWELRGYWHGSADRIQPLESAGGRSTRGTRMNWYYGLQASLPLPGGGRTTGAGVVHRGDTALPADLAVISDGTSYWVWTHEYDDRSSADWYEYEPVSGERGRRALPGFMADVLAAAPADSAYQSGTLLPTAATEPTPIGRPADGLLGWCVVTLPDGSLRGQDLTGASVTVPKGSNRPLRALLLPGAERPSAVVRGHYEVSIVDPDGVVTAEARTDRAPGVFGEGSLILPPTAYWHCMTPRDPQGSIALRRIDDETASALLKAGVEQRTAGESQDRLPALVRELLPQVGHEALLAGITGVVRFAAEQRATLDHVAARLEESLKGGTPQDSGPVGPTDDLLAEPLRSLGADRTYWGSGRDGIVDGTYRQIRLIGAAARAAVADESGSGSESAPSPAFRLHLDGSPLPSPATAWWTAMLNGCSALAFRAASAATAPEIRDGLRALLAQYDAAALAAPADATPWRHVTVYVADKHLNKPDGNRRPGSWHGLLPLPGGALLAVIGSEWGDNGALFTALCHDPSGRFAIPEPYQVRSSTPVGEAREAGWLAAFLAEWDERGPVPWFPEAAEEFSRLTGVTSTEARLVMAGMPGVDHYDRNFLPSASRTLLGVKAADAAVARDQLSRIAAESRRAVLAALLPGQPSRLWTEGPDAAAAAQVWNRLVGRRTAVPEALLAEAVRAVRIGWGPTEALPALVDPAASPELSNDLTWHVDGDRVAPTDENAVGFTAKTLTSSVELAAWLAYRLPAGDQIRATLPTVLDALRARLANPQLLLGLGPYVNLPEFRKAAGAPTEVGKGFERYGAVIMATHDDQPMPALRVAELDASGGDPYIPVLRRDGKPFAVEVALRLVRDPRFAALLADPGDPVAGERGEDGTWSPQDPTRSVPDLVAEAAKEHGLGEDAAALYLMLLALPDPADKNAARWTGWKPARFKAAHAELAATDLVVEASRTRAGRSLFLPGGWNDLRAPFPPLEQWKLPLSGGLVSEAGLVLGAAVPTVPVAELYRRAWQRVRDGDGPRFEEFKAARTRRR